MEPQTTTFTVQPAFETDEMVAARERLKKKIVKVGYVAGAGTGSLAGIGQLVDLYFDLSRASPVSYRNRDSHNFTPTKVAETVIAAVPVDTVVSHVSAFASDPVSPFRKHVTVALLGFAIVALVATLVVFWSVWPRVTAVGQVDAVHISDAATIHDGTVKADGVIIGDELHMDFERQPVAPVEGKQAEPTIKQPEINIDTLTTIAIIVSMYSVSLIATLIATIFGVWTDWRDFLEGSMLKRMAALLFGFFAFQWLFLVALACFGCVLYGGKWLGERLEEGPLGHPERGTVWSVVCAGLVLLRGVIAFILTVPLVPLALFMRFALEESTLFDGLMSLCRW